MSSQLLKLSSTAQHNNNSIQSEVEKNLDTNRVNRQYVHIKQESNPNGLTTCQFRVSKNISKKHVQPIKIYPKTCLTNQNISKKMFNQSNHQTCDLPVATMCCQPLPHRKLFVLKTGSRHSSNYMLSLEHSIGLEWSDWRQDTSIGNGSKIHLLAVDFQFCMLHTLAEIAITNYSDMTGNHRH